MISQKKALSQSWVAQRRALAKIEAAKHGEAADEVAAHINDAKSQVEHTRSAS